MGSGSLKVGGEGGGGAKATGCWIFEVSKSKV